MSLGEPLESSVIVKAGNILQITALSLDASASSARPKESVCQTLKAATDFTLSCSIPKSEGFATQRKEDSTKQFIFE